jgi:thymidylate synthase (FAD)
MSKIEVTLIDSMGSDLTVVNSARVSYGKRTDTLTDKDKKLIKYLINHEHMSVFEHCTISVLIKCPLYIRSQIHRHRTFSYNEISRRYTDEKIEFYRPEKFRTQHTSSKQASGQDVDQETNNKCIAYSHTIEEGALMIYNDMISMGVARELARGILPQSLMTEFYMTGNLRNWAHFLKLRLDSHSQYEIQLISNKILDILKDIYPVATEALVEKASKGTNEDKSS